MTWTSGNPNVVSLSTDDPPILTALAAGHVTIVAGTAPNAASADVTVFAGPLPIGTVIWSNPGDGSGVNYIVPAVPSTSGVADVFAFQADGTVQAITSDGTVAWTADLSQARYALPDFQGGLVVVTPVVAGQSSIYKLDGISGQPYPAYTASGTASLGAWGGSLVAVHPDGTIFAVQQNSDPATYSEWDSVIGIDPATGAQKFSVDLHSWPGFVWDIMIAGDGYAYVVSSSRDFSANTSQLYLLRVNSSGAYDDFGAIYEWVSASGDILDPNVGMITNADQGILLTWSAGWGGMALTAGTGVSLVNPPAGPGGGVVPILQAQDGSFVGSYYNDMIAFDASGNVRWIVPNETPQIATADGGVIGQSGITYDQYGNATGMIPNMPTYSWTENAYTDGPVDQVSAALVDFALSFKSSINPLVYGMAQNGTAVKYVPSPMFIPATLTEYNGVFNLATVGSSYLQEIADLSQYYHTAVNAISPTHVALYPLLLGQATKLRFLGALGITNMIVGYIDHGQIVEDQHQTNARGLCFSNGCIAPAALDNWTYNGSPYQLNTTQPSGQEIVLENGFTPKAKVVFLAACGIDANFLAQWHLAAQGQALIVPQYNNPGLLITLASAANEWNVMLQALGNGNTVAQAVAAGVARAVINNSQYTWIIPQGGDGNVSFKAKPAQ